MHHLERCSHFDSRRQVPDPPTFIELLETLNDDVLGIIWTKLPVEFKMCIDRTTYITNHSLIRPRIAKEDYLKYVLDMVNNDYAFVFGLILKERFMSFHNWKRYIHEGQTYPSFLLFLLDYACSKNAMKCIEAIRTAANNNGFGANWYKSRASIRLIE